MDSLDGMEVTLEVEQRFGFTSEKVPTTLGELWALAEGLQEKTPPKPPPAGWFDPPTDDAPLTIPGETVAEAFLNQAFARPKMVDRRRRPGWRCHLRKARDRRVRDGRAIPHD